MKDKEKQYISMKEMLTKRSIEPITNCNCKVASRIEYTDNEKQIEEMAQCKNFSGITCSECEVRAGCDRYTLAEELYEQDYRKLPEDSVVLSKEEYEKLKHFEHRVRSGVCMTQKEWFDFCNEDSNRRTCLRIEEREKERKETAEKLIKFVSEHCDNETLIWQLDEFVEKSLGVEIKE